MTPRATWPRELNDPPGGQVEDLSVRFKKRKQNKDAAGKGLGCASPARSPAAPLIQPRMFGEDTFQNERFPGAAPRGAFWRVSPGRFPEFGSPGGKFGGGGNALLGIIPS